MNAGSHSSRWRGPTRCSSPPTRTGCSHPLERAELVAVGIAQIGEVEVAHSARAHPRRILDRLAAGLDARLVPGVGLLGAVHREADRAAVADGRRLAVD